MSVDVVRILALICKFKPNLDKDCFNSHHVSTMIFISVEKEDDH